jgi:hypothetical protein
MIAESCLIDQMIAWLSAERPSCWMLDAGCWMLDAGCWMLDASKT